MIINLVPYLTEPRAGHGCSWFGHEYKDKYKDDGNFFLVVVGKHWADAYNLK